MAVITSNCGLNAGFWGPEVRYWELPGVWSTAVGYTAGLTPVGLFCLKKVPRSAISIGISNGASR